MKKFELQRQYYPVLAHRCFLNTAQNGLIPSFAQEAMTKYIENRTLNALDLERMDLLWDDSWNVRSQIGRMLNCGADEVCFGSSASDLYNIFSNGIGMKAGENIVTYDSAYFSTLFTWYNKEKEGIELRIAKNVEGVVSAESLMELCDEKTRAISICMVDFGLGYRHDVKKLGEFCRANNIYLAVDATQACGAMKIDFKDMKIEGDSVFVHMNDLFGGYSRVEDIQGFELAGEDRVFHPATARYFVRTVSGQRDESILLLSPAVKKPVAVRYCFRNFQVGNLKNAAGLPLFPFRTDQW